MFVFVLTVLLGSGEVKGHTDSRITVVHPCLKDISCIRVYVCVCEFECVTPESVLVPTSVCM